ncbi:MAG TPA: sensor histidine kinase [Nocardioidaceae bacterium]|nr:sensor histidine kinase [Nocardioidaceae bacterium]
MTTETWRQGPLDGPPRGPILAIVGPLVLTAFTVVGTFGAAHGATGRRGLDVLAIALAIAVPLSLLGLRRHPVAVVWFVALGTLGYLLRNYPYGPIMISLVVAVVAAVMLGHRWAAWLALGTVYVGHLALRGEFRDEPWSWGAAAGFGAWALVVLIGAEFARVRRERVVAGRQARAETARRQANEERLRIARELHDVVAHHISLINVQAGVALHLVDRKPEQVETALAAIKDASKEALSELRSLVGVLRDEADTAPRSPTTTLATLDELVERTGHAGLTLHKSTSGDVRTLPTAVELAAVRIVQEAITNIVRHADAREAELRLDYGADMLTVQVEDDGSGGGRIDAIDEGSGLRGMRERATSLGGTLTIEAAPAGGLRVTARLPLEESTAEAPA